MTVPERNGHWPYMFAIARRALQWCQVRVPGTDRKACPSLSFQASVPPQGSEKICVYLVDAESFQRDPTNSLGGVSCARAGQRFVLPRKRRHAVVRLAGSDTDLIAPTVHSCRQTTRGGRIAARFTRQRPGPSACVGRQATQSRKQCGGNWFARSAGESPADATGPGQSA